MPAFPGNWVLPRLNKSCCSTICAAASVCKPTASLQTGRDVVIAALLGAEEFGFATAPLIAMGCIMMRKCHLNTCSVGIATQDPELRKLCKGQPEHVINFFFFIAEQVRQYMAEWDSGKLMTWWAASICSMRSPRSITGKPAAWICRPFSTVRRCPARVARHCVQTQDHGWNQALDHQLIKIRARGSGIAHAGRDEFPHPQCASHGGRDVERRNRPALWFDGLPDDTIRIHFKGSAGQSFGAFLAKGITLTLEGEANDYVGKGLSGGRVIVYPPQNSRFAAEENILIGNVVLYGATSWRSIL